VHTVVGPPAPPPPAPPGVREQVARRITGAPAPISSAPSQNYRAVVHAFT